MAFAPVIGGVDIGAGTHGVDDHGIVAVDTEDADLEQVAIVGGTNAHREVVIELPLRDGLRTAWSMSSSVMPCFRAVCAMRTK
jgi:hypothetical protein